MGAKISLTKGEVEVVLPAPAGASGAAFASGRVTGRTSGGEVYSYGIGAERFEAEIALRSLSPSEREALLGFYRDEALGTAETWTLAGPDAGEYTARFLDDSLAFARAPGGGWDVTLRLELSALLA